MASRRLSFFLIASSVGIVFLTLQPAQAAPQAAGLIRCPDWQHYVTPAAAIRTTPPKQSFDAALAVNRARESRLAAKSQAGQGASTRTLASNRSASGRATTESGPLDAAGIFSRDGRRDSNKARKRRAKPAIKPGPAAPCPAYTVRKGDTLAKIATRRLGNSRRWPELAKANTLTSPSILRIGQTLRLPCAPDGQLKPWQAATGAGAGSTPTTLAPKPQVPAKPMTRLPVWTARPGEFVSDVITRWAKRAGHTVVRDGVEEWKISVPVTIRGSFKHALDQLVVGFEGSGRPLAISLYANKVIRIGRPL